MFALLVPQLIGALAIAMASLVGRVLLAVGVGFVTYTGITVAVATVKATVISNVGALPSQALGLVGYLWFDKGLTLIFSCIAASLAMKAIGGTVKKAVLK